MFRSEAEVLYRRGQAPSRCGSRVDLEHGSCTRLGPSICQHRERRPESGSGASDQKPCDRVCPVTVLIVVKRPGSRRRSRTPLASQRLSRVLVHSARSNPCHRRADMSTHRRPKKSPVLRLGKIEHLCQTGRRPDDQISKLASLGRLVTNPHSQETGPTAVVVGRRWNRHRFVWHNKLGAVRRAALERAIDVPN